MGKPTTIPFPEWDGEDAQHLTVAPDETVYRVPSGAHERLHSIVVGSRNLANQFEGLHGTKVELALAGWVQLQSDRLTDRINIDAPDGFENTTLVRQFAQMHDAGSVAVALYPSNSVRTGTVEELSLSGDGPRVPSAENNNRTTKEW